MTKTSQLILWLLFFCFWNIIFLIPAIRWGDLNTKLKDKLRQQAFTVIATIGAIALVAYIVHLANTVDTPIGAAFVISGFNSIFPMFAKMLVRGLTVYIQCTHSYEACACIYVCVRVCLLVTHRLLRVTKNSCFCRYLTHRLLIFC